MKGRKPPTNNIAKALSERNNKAKQTLITQNVYTEWKQDALPVYYQNVNRVPIRPIRQALRECLPTWALLRMSFIGSSVLEIFARWRLKERLIGKLKVLGIEQIENFDSFNTAPGTRTNVETAEMGKKKEICFVVRQITSNIRNTHNVHAR